MLTWDHIRAYEDHRAELIRQLDMERMAREATVSSEPAPVRYSLLAWLGSRLTAWGEWLQEQSAARPAADKAPVGPRPVVARLILLGGEVYRLPIDSRELRVVSGRAWVTHDGRDHVLSRGSAAALKPSDDLALVSALGRTPLVIEVLGPRTVRPAVGLVANSATPALSSI